MSLNKNNLLLFIPCFYSVFGLAQESKTAAKDSLSMQKLDEVVVTGESQVMSLSKKLFAVGVLEQKDIAKVAGNNLADILNYNLNITVTPDPSTGRSTISMFGLDGQYVKVLIDGIPMASDNGMGNNIDITQINLEDVERIEIVEGSMGVLYGDNAVAGVINIVTKRGLENDYKWQLQVSVQEETVGSEYALFDEGRHIQNAKLSHQLSDKTSISIGGSRNDNAGFFNNYQGKNYVNIQDNAVVNDSLRGMEWNPKEQFTAFGNLNTALGKHAIFYKIQYYDESVPVYNHYVNGRLDSNTGMVNPTALDENFDTQRLMNNLNISGPLKGPTIYNLSLSHQTQKRYYKQFVYNIRERGIASVIADDLSQSSEIWYSKGFVSNMVPTSDFFNLQLGYEFNHQTGFDAIATGEYSSDVVENTLENYDFFGVADFNITDRFSVFPGARFTNNSQFGNKLIWSLSSTYNISNTFKIKGVFGSAFRAPNFEELFFYFVDSNHNVQGNPKLDPEDGISLFLNVEEKFRLSDKSMLKTALKSYYFDIDDKIASVIVTDDEDRNLFTFDNVDYSKILGFSLENSLIMDRWQASLGMTYLGQSTAIDASQVSNSDYLWSFNLQSSLGYTIPSINTTLSAQLKYTGRTQIVENNTGGTELGQTDDFTWMDASARVNITKNLSLTLGARNIFDIVRVNASDTPSGAHGSSGVPSRLFGNGRSYYLKLLYNLNFN
ncbi:TonB-dependent receptor plug [Allomuricauda ruestringensis DSM 13258]|uniref:TonB-dependent receptor plug n=1 Tax=Allomuricauda ruestringensis (strain DSM 13258 / CIP 107369 / LMG 19739 / B1) TaxID=886377 RepID=G2PK67_ALLRU|nr:TonB-dependent receptor [Allomuricauda ruestringensis]AEM69841.1 TonB-dependent receptor plug [Allomuricauda ruestringensis DSM 13258]